MLPRKPKLPRGISMLGDRYRVRVSYEYKQYDIGQFESLTVAKAALEQARIDIATRQFIPPAERRRRIKERMAADESKALMVREWAATWIGTLRGNVSPGTIATYESALRAHVLPRIGDLRLVDVTRDDVTKILESIPTKGARDNAHRVMRAMFAKAVEQEAGGITASPVAGMTRTHKPRRDRLRTDQLLTVETVEEIADLMPEHLRIAPVLALWLALRQGELLGMQRQDFRDLDKPEHATYVIERQWHSKVRPPDYAPPKSGSARGPLSIPPHIVPLIVEHLAKYVGGLPESPILPSPHDPSRPISQSALDRQWREARDAKAPGYRFHDLRHIGLTEYARAGATLQELMARGGHTDVKVAMIYQSVSLERDRANAAKMSAEREKGEK